MALAQRNGEIGCALGLQRVQGKARTAAKAGCLSKVGNAVMRPLQPQPFG